MNPPTTGSWLARRFDAVTSRQDELEVALLGDALEWSDRGARHRVDRSGIRQSDRTADGEARFILVEPAGTILTLPREAVPALTASGLLRSAPAATLGALRGVLITGGAIVLIVVGFLLFGLGPLAGVLARMVPADTERALGRATFTQFASGQATTDSLAASGLRKAAMAVAPAGLELQEVALLEDSTIVNAFALPGGYVVVYRGILNRMDDEAELLGVLAHELGHVEARHGVKRIARSAALSLFLSLAFGDAPGAASVLLRNAAQLVSLEYDRDEEREADDFAVATLRQRGLDVGGLARLFEKLERLEGRVDLPAFLSTHPPTQERIARLRSGVSEGAMPEERQVLTAEEAEALFSRRVH